MKKRIGVLLSGRGSNFEALAESVATGRIPNAEIAIVISNREGAPGIQCAASLGIPNRVIPSKGLEREVYDRQVAAVLDEDTDESLPGKILREEHRFYSGAVKIVLQGKYRIAGRRVFRSSSIQL